MYPEKLNSSLTFGWSAPIHGKLIEKSMSECTLPKYVTTLLENGAKEEELINISSKKISNISKFLLKLKIFLRKGRKQTVEEKYLLHCKKFHESMQAGEPNIAIKEAGKAIRYIHELTAPKNISDDIILSDNLVDKSFEGYKHKYNFASKTLKDLFAEVFKTTQKGSTNNEKIAFDSSTNYLADNLTLAIDATNKFLQLIGLR